ncbi:hypothetical protein K6T82_05075 [Flavobacterium sp. 17A]|uniref:Peptidase family M23 n=1 Tax=Flavobacterium potami TaxID=2872310 RepID=A0A9X1H8L1_9FLAO|nr:hypothetical protein [Flavobacterium potami]MBZ4034127.1 hypothetical protein [Flavobacterium potami]
MSKSNFLRILVFFLVGFNTITAQNQIYITKVRNLDNSVEFKYNKAVQGNYFVEFNIENVSNVKDIASIKKTYNVNLIGDTGTLFKLYPDDKEKPINCSYSYSYTRGLIKPQIDYAVTYLLPFKENKNVTIYESNRFNVRSDIWKNYVVYSKTKDTICAMRKGVVVDIKRNALDNKGSIVFKTEIIVDHADGTNASYVGIDEKSLAVKVNDAILPGTYLGVMDDILDEGKNRNFKFNIYYFSNEEIDGVDGEKNVKIIEKSVMPVFYTSNGYQNLMADQNYTVKYTDEILFKEMTPEEKTNYKS